VVNGGNPVNCSVCWLFPLQLMGANPFFLVEVYSLDFLSPSLHSLFFIFIFFIILQYCMYDVHVFNHQRDLKKKKISRALDSLFTESGDKNVHTFLYV